MSRPTTCPYIYGQLLHYMMYNVLLLILPAYWHSLFGIQQVTICKM